MTIERKDFIAEYERVAAIAEKIAIAKAVAYGNGHTYPETYEFRPSLDREGNGVWLYDIDTPQYEDHGWEVEHILVTWEDIDRADELLAELKVEEGRRKEREARANDVRRRELLERLKKELGE